MKKIELFRCTDDPDNISVIQLVGILHPHIRPGIDRIQETVPDIGMDLEGEVAGS